MGCSIKPGKGMRRKTNRTMYRWIFSSPIICYMAVGIAGRMAFMRSKMDQDGVNDAHTKSHGFHTTVVKVGVIGLAY